MPSLTIGFRTASNALYRLDRFGRTHRFEREGGVLGDLKPPSACVFVGERLMGDIRRAERSGLRVSMARLERGVLKDCCDPVEIRAAWEAGESAGVRIHNTILRAMNGGPGERQAGVGLYPFEENAKGHHLGKRIVEIYHDDGTLVRHGFPVMHMLTTR